MGKGHDLELIDVHKRYGPTCACHDVSLRIAEGEFFFILGPSGCGKTTLLNIIAGLVQPDAGSVSLGGTSLRGIPAYRRDINTVFQRYALFPHLSVAENVGFGLKMRGVPNVERKQSVLETLEVVGLKGLGHRRPQELSGGQQQRVALARALINRPSILLLDEPLSALDVQLRVAMRGELKRLHSQYGSTFIYVTHDQEEAFSMADRMAIMNEGRMVQVGRPEEIYNRPESLFVSLFVGEANHIDLTKLRSENSAHIHITRPSNTLRHNDDMSASTDTCVIMIRPERIEVHAQEPMRTDIRNYVSGTIKEIQYLGARRNYLVEVGGVQTVKAIEQTRSNQPHFSLGQKVFLVWHVEESVEITR